MFRCVSFYSGFSLRVLYTCSLCTPFSTLGIWSRVSRTNYLEVNVLVGDSIVQKSFLPVSGFLSYTKRMNVKIKVKLQTRKKTESTKFKKMYVKKGEFFEPCFIFQNRLHFINKWNRSLYSTLISWFKNFFLLYSYTVYDTLRQSSKTESIRWRSTLPEGTTQVLLWVPSPYCSGVGNTSRSVQLGHNCQRLLGVTVPPPSWNPPLSVSSPVPTMTVEGPSLPKETKRRQHWDTSRRVYWNLQSHLNHRYLHFTPTLPFNTEST